jgi:hypothetical protein
VRALLAATTLGQYLSSKPPSAVLTLTTAQTAGQALRALAAASVLSAPLFDAGRCLGRQQAAGARARRWERPQLGDPRRQQHAPQNIDVKTFYSADYLPLFPRPRSSSVPGDHDRCNAAAPPPPARANPIPRANPTPPPSGDFVGFLDLNDILRAFLGLVNIRELSDDNREYRLRTAGARARRSPRPGPAASPSWALAHKTPQGAALPSALP